MDKINLGTSGRFPSARGRAHHAGLSFCISPACGLLRQTVSIRHTICVTTRGQFAKRIRGTGILGNDGRRFERTTKPARKIAPVQPIRRTMTPHAMIQSSLTSLASTGAGVFLLGFIVFIHEGGHFLAARLQQIRVRTFSIGFGPTILRLTPKWSETEFTIRLLPLGGFVSFPEHVTVDKESGEEVVNNDPNLLQNRPVLDRAIVISAGVIANIVLAWTAIFSSVCTIGVPVFTVHPGALIANVFDEQGPAALAGLQRQDVIVAVDGRAVEGSLDSASVVAEEIRTSRGNTLRLRVSRSGEEMEVSVRPKCCLPDGSSSVGVQLVPNATVVRRKPPSVVKGVSMANSEFSRLFGQTLKGLSKLVFNFRASSQNLSGPLGVVSMGADLARNDTAALLTFCAVISINLAVINALPLPALDGGQMTFLLIEALRGAPVSTKVQDAVNRTALILLLALSGVLLFGDLERLNVAGAFQKLLS